MKKGSIYYRRSAQMLGVHPRTLRINEEEGLIKPLRKGKRRSFTMDAITWIECLRTMTHEHGASTVAMKQLLHNTRRTERVLIALLTNASSVQRLCPTD